MAAVTPTMGRRRVGGVLRKLRNDAKLTNTQAASASGVSTAKISRLETGHNVVYMKDIRGLLEAYDPSPTMRDKLLRFAQLAEQQGWWEEFDDVLPPDFDLYLSVEEAAATLLVFNATLVHGLLQTEDYARAWIRAEDPGMPNAELERLISLRMTRQQLLDRREDPLTIWMIFDEAVLRRKVGEPELMSAQLDHLLTLSERRNVTIQILPFDAGPHVAATGSFTLIEFTEPTDPEIGYVDSAAGNVYPENPRRVRMLKTNFHHLTSAALTPERSLEFIRSVQKE